jgi:hypothetical protein
MKGMLRDACHALRLLRIRPAFAGVALATLAFGIGINAAVFTLIDAVERRGLPFPAAGRLMAIETRQLHQPEEEPWTSAEDFFDLRERARSFSRVAAISPVWNVVLIGGAEARRLESLVIGRRRAAVTEAAAREELRRIGAQLAQEHPASNRGAALGAQPLAGQVEGRYRTSLLLLAGAVAFVLLMACANVANLMLARNVARQQEMTVRIALGAAGGRLLRQLLSEGLVLAALGGLSGWRWRRVACARWPPPLRRACCREARSRSAPGACCSRWRRCSAPRASPGRCAACSSRWPRSIPSSSAPPRRRSASAARWPATSRPGARPASTRSRPSATSERGFAHPPAESEAANTVLLSLA